MWSEGEGENHDKQSFLSHRFVFLLPETGNVGKGADLCQKMMSPILEILRLMISIKMLNGKNSNIC